MEKMNQVKKIRRRLFVIPTMLLLGIAMLFVYPVESRKRPDVFLSAITKLKKSGIVKIWHKKAIKGGKVRCDTKYRATRKLDKAFLHAYNLTCWSCPRGYKRSLDPNVAGRKACFKKAYSKWSKIKYRGKGKRVMFVGIRCPRGSFRHGLTDRCYSCPGGYKRTVFHINSRKACEQVIRARHTRAHKRGKPGCNRGYFQNGLSDRCYKCPKGYKRTLVITKDPSRHRRACEKLKVNPPKAIKRKLLKHVNMFKKSVLGKHKKNFGKIITSIKKLKNKPNFFKMNNKQRVAMAQNAMKKLNISRLLRSVFRNKKKNVFSTTKKADGETCSSDSDCSSNFCNYVTKKCINHDWKSTTLSIAIDASFVGSLEKAITVAFKYDNNSGGSSSPAVYEEGYLGVGPSIGGDISLDIGHFVDTNDNLSGELMGVTFSLAYAGGLSVSLWFTCPGTVACYFGSKNYVYFTGVQFGPAAGTGVEVEYGVVTAKKLF